MVPALIKTTNDEARLKISEATLRGRDGEVLAIHGLVTDCSLIRAFGNMDINIATMCLALEDASQRRLSSTHGIINHFLQEVRMSFPCADLTSYESHEWLEIPNVEAIPRKVAPRMYKTKKTAVAHPGCIVQVVSTGFRSEVLRFERWFN